MADLVEVKPPIKLKSGRSSFLKDSSLTRSSRDQTPVMVDDDDRDIKPKDELDPDMVALAKSRHEADLKKHAYEDKSAGRIQDESVILLSPLWIWH